MADEASILEGVAASRERIADKRSIPTSYRATTCLMSIIGANDDLVRRPCERRYLRTSRISLGGGRRNRPFRRGGLLCLVDRHRVGGLEEPIAERARTMLSMTRLLETRGGDILLERTMKKPSRKTFELKPPEKGEAIWTHTHPLLPTSLFSSTTLYLGARPGSTWERNLNLWNLLLQDLRVGRRSTSRTKT